MFTRPTRLPGRTSESRRRRARVRSSGRNRHGEVARFLSARRILNDARRRARRVHFPRRCYVTFAHTPITNANKASGAKSERGTW